MILFARILKVTTVDENTWRATAELRKGKKVLLNGTGEAPSIEGKLQYQLEGEYIKHPQVGQVFSVTSHSLITKKDSSMPDYIRDCKWRLKYG